MKRLISILVVILILCISVVPAYAVDNSTDGDLVALYHFDGNLTDAAGNVTVVSLDDGSSVDYVSNGAFGSCVNLTDRSRFSIQLPETIAAPYTVEFKAKFGDYIPFYLLSSDRCATSTTAYYQLVGSGHTASGFIGSNVYIRSSKTLSYSYNLPQVCLSGIADGSSVNLFTMPWFSTSVSQYEYPTSLTYYGVKSVSSMGLFTYAALDLAYVPDSVVASASKYAGAVSGDPFSKSVTFNGLYANRTNSIPLGEWFDIAIVNDGSSVKCYLNGTEFTPSSFWTVSSGQLNAISFLGAPGFSYSYYDELRISKGALYEGNYVPAEAPFDDPVLPPVEPDNPLPGEIPEEMQPFFRFFEIILDFFKMPMTVYGFTFSFWDIALWGCVAYIAIRIIRGLLDG